MLGANTKKTLRFIAANVRRLRLKGELTQEKLAEKADLAPRFLQQVESASVNLSVDPLCKLAGALGVAPEALLKKAELAVARPGRPPDRRR